MSRIPRHLALLLVYMSLPSVALWGATPAISSISPTSGQPGTQVTIKGTGFGSAAGTVTFNGAKAAIISWSSAGTQIVAAAPSGTAGSGPVVVNGKSNGVTFTFGPTITSIAPQNVTTGQTVSIVGLNFGSATGTVTISSQSAKVVSWKTNTISVTVPANVVVGADSVVVTNSVGSSPAATLSVQFAPSISSISPTKGQPFTPVTINGTGFGAGTPGRVTFNGSSAQIVSWTNTKIVVDASDGLAGSGPVVVSWNGVSSNGVTFSFLPTILALVPSTVKVGYTFGLIGENFLSSTGTVTLNGSKLTTTFWSNFLILATVPSGAKTGPVVVTTSVGASNTQTLTVQGGSTPLTITAMASPPPNAAGWNNTNVTVTFTCNGGVAPVQCPATQTVTTEGANQTITGTAKDASGATATASVSLNIDKTAPGIAAIVSPPANSNGWINKPATVTFSCTDALSGVASCPSQQSVSQGANQVISGTATDKAGNSSSTSVTLNVGTTPPTITATVSPTPNANGWNTTPVTITYLCTPGFAPISVCPAAQTVSTAGANQQVTGTVTDLAGNSASVTTTLNIDLSGPTITGTVTPTPNASGWNNTAVTVTFTCTAGSVAVASCTPTQTLSGQGANQQVTGTVVDIAGDSASVTVPVNIDTTVPIISAAASPPAGANGLSTLPVTVTFTCSDALSGIQTCPSPVTVTTPGSQLISGQAVDLAGNTALALLPVNTESSPLAVTATASPALNSAQWINSNVTVSFVCSGGVAPVQCPPPSIVSGEGQNQSITGTANDAINNTASASVSVSIDKTPPSITITSPANGSNAGTPQAAIQGVVTDALSGVNTVTCNGAAATVVAAAFSCNVNLPPGSSNVAVTASDIAGNIATSNLALVYAPPIAIQISTPTSMQLFSSNPVTVTGTVGDPTAVVTVGGVTATVSNGTFTATGIVLREGKNLLTATATNPVGGSGSDTVTVYLDTTPPVIQIASPTGGAIVTTAQINVLGNVNDHVSGTVNQADVSVTVNGVTAAVANRSFSAHGVLLVPGLNTITAVATDRAGNTSQNQVQITFQPPAGVQTLSVVSGDGQSGIVSSILPQPLTVEATDSNGLPIANLLLTFTVTKSDGIVVAGTQQGQTLSVRTGTNGQASVQFQLGSRTGVGINQVAASAPGFVAQTVFSADTTVGSPSEIFVVSGEIQTAAVGTAAPEPLIAVVLDAAGNPIAGVPVTFTVQSGGGLIGGKIAATSNTDSDGKAYAAWVLGAQPGTRNNTVTASFSGMTGLPAVFIGSGAIPGPVASTAVSGVVLDDADQPIPNATASIEGTNLSALSNSQGQFLIVGVPAGDVVLFVDGSTSTRTETFPTLSFQMATIPGINNSLGHPVYLPALDTTNTQVVGGNQPVQLTMNGIPGLIYTVAANSVTFPDGSHVGPLTLSQVHSDRVPMIPNNGSAPRLVGTLQPAGVLFNPPIQMQLPNTGGLQPGQVVEISSFRHDLEQFVVEGTARVSADGSVVVSDPGFGITVSGWHDVGGGGGGGPSPPPSCGDGCGPCKACVLGACIPNPAAYGNKCTLDDKCKTNTTCNLIGSCTGDDVTVNSISGACVTPINQDVQFTVNSNAPDKVHWVAGAGGTPVMGDGATFTTQYSTTGLRGITASCAANNNSTNLNVATTCPASTPVVPTYTQHINLGHLSLGNGPGVTFYHGAMSSGYLIDPNDLMDNMCLASGGTNWQESLQGASKAVDSERRLLPQWTQIVVGSNTTAANYCQQIQSVITISVDRNFNASWMDINLINVHENWHVNTLETSYTTQMSLFQPTLEALTVPTGGSQVCDATSAKQQVQTQRTNAIIQTNQLFEQALLAIHDLDEANAQASEAAPRAALIQSICSYARSQHFASCSLCQ